MPSFLKEKFHLDLAAGLRATVFIQVASMAGSALEALLGAPCIYGGLKGSKWREGMWHATAA